ncbi:glycosyltransferase [Thalassobaculum sp.]|uniref:glycosyltransferase n=1 Tax=Thalassobaculum sp. TaxID=2022740 RepID=UPI0032EE726A
MRCLWLTWVDPLPEHDGQRMYSGRLIQAMAGAGVDVHVLCTTSSGSQRRDGDREEGVTWHLVQHPFPPVWMSVASSLPHIAHRSAAPAMQARLASMLSEARWDCIVFDGLGTGWALDPVREALDGASPRSRVVYLSHNHETSMRASIATGVRRRPIRAALMHRDAEKVARLEQRLVDIADLVTAITPDDAERFAEQATDKPILVLPPGYNGRRVAVRRITSDVPRRAIVVGSFEWIAKQMNLREFLTAADPLFAAAGAELEIVGAGDPRFFDELRGGLGATRLVGRVDSISSYLDQARIAVVAERLGGGFKLKVLDYVFNRLPIAALAGSVAGTPLAADASMLTFDDHTPLAKGVLSALDDLDLLNRLQTAAYEACADRFDWSDRGERLSGSIAAL